MILFSEILSPSCAATGVSVETKDAALVAAIDLLAKGGKISDKARLLEEMRARERLSSTGIGEGVAVPHALCDAIPQTVMAVLHLSHPIDFASLDGAPVDLIFMMAGPRGATANHLKILSKLARLLHDGEFREAARKASDGPALAQLLFDRD
jgi:fructose-specific phosphotransferase system IIA component